MKFFNATLIFLFLLVLSIGVVCAGDTNQYFNDNLEISDNDVISDSEKSFNDLSDDINKSSDSIALQCNYKYDIENDKNNTVIDLNNVKYLIDGNNKVIDGNNKAGFLNILNDSDVTIRNIIIKNCNASAINVYNSNLTLINVVFENNREALSGSAIYCEYSIVNVNKSTFLNNYAPNGASIYLYQSKIAIDGSLFRNDNPIQWSMIKGYDAYIEYYF